MSKPTVEQHQVIADWFQRNGWQVFEVHDDFDRDVYAWRHDSGGQRFTLRITETVLEDVGVNSLGSLLDNLKVAGLLRARPDAYTVVTKTDGGAIGVHQLDTPPRRTVR